MKRLEATKRVGGLVERVVSGEGRYLPRVREVWIFGSYARGVPVLGTQIHRSCRTGVFVDQSAESVVSVELFWRVRTHEA